MSSHSSHTRLRDLIPPDVQARAAKAGVDRYDWYAGRVLDDSQVVDSNSVIGPNPEADTALLDRAVKTARRAQKEHHGVMTSIRRASRALRERVVLALR